MYIKDKTLINLLPIFLCTLWTNGSILCGSKDEGVNKRVHKVSIFVAGVHEYKKSLKIAKPLHLLALYTPYGIMVLNIANVCTVIIEK